jgi:long-chain fatty acid transport protein
MTQRSASLFFALVILVILPGNALANGFRLPDQDAFATARGDAFAATADNPSAVYYNPAGLTQLEGNNLRAGLYEIHLDQSFQPPATAPNHGHTYFNHDNFAAVPQFFYAHTLTNLPMSLGLGVYAPYGGKSSWPKNTGFNVVAMDATLTCITINPVVALKLLPNLSVGAGVTFNYANLKIDQGLKEYPTPFANYFSFNGSGWSVGCNEGILWQPIKSVSIGATARNNCRVRLNGHTSYEQLPFVFPTTEPAELVLKFPFSLTTGISYRPTPRWNIEFDADYTDWSSFGSNNIHQAATVWPVNADISMQMDWRPSWIYEFGATRYFDSGWQISGGIVYNENSVPNKFYSPLVADMDRYFLCIGTGYKGKQFSFDIACQFGYGPGHEVTGSQPSSTVTQSTTSQNANGNYHFTSQALSASAGWKF